MKEVMKVLIAEMDVEIVYRLKKYLKFLGHKVFPVVTSGEDLLKQVKLLDPTLIITDINLNGQLDGIEAIARLGSSHEIPYIFIAAFDDLRGFISSYNLNPVSIIKKPVTQANLMECLEKAQIEMELVLSEV